MTIYITLPLLGFLVLLVGEFGGVIWFMAVMHRDVKEVIIGMKEFKTDYQRRIDEAAVAHKNYETQLARHEEAIQTLKDAKT